MSSARRLMELEVLHKQSEARARLAELRAIFPLPGAHDLTDVFLDRTCVHDLELYMVGLVAGTNSTAVTGAAAERGGYPVDRAWFELVERTSVLLARERAERFTVRDRDGRVVAQRACGRVFPRERSSGAPRPSLSNGAAFQRSWPEACEAALCELVERDRVLRSFAGEVAPTSLAHASRDLTFALRGDYKVCAYSFDPEGPLQHRVAGVFLFPQRADAPLSYGFGAARSLGHALEGAEREALQRLAFLWGEALPTSPPVLAQTPDYHQEFYLYPPHHDKLRAWLDGASARLWTRSSAVFDGERTSFVDLTPSESRLSFAVTKAMSPRARVLRFGDVPERSGAAAPHPII